VEDPSKEKINIQDLIVVGTNDQCETSTLIVERLFSLKRRRFIRPYQVLKYGLQYRILPGVYLVIYSKLHRRADSCMTWYIRKVRISKDEKGQVEEKILKEVQWLTPLDQSERTVPILSDIENPEFHGHSRVPEEKEYSEEEVKKLIDGGIDPALESDFE
jgi:hypothetical protein